MTSTQVIRMERLADLSLSPLLTIEAEESLWDAWQLMFLSGRRHLVVVDDESHCLGVIADRAILSEIPLTEERLTQRSVRQVMTTPEPLCLEATPRDAAQRMIDSATEAIPLVDATGRLHSMVTSSDLARWLAAH